MSECTEKLINAEALKEYIENRIGYLHKAHISEIKKQSCLYAYEGILETIDKMKDYSLNGGWIPCDENFPKENGYYLVTYKKNEKLLVGYWLFNGIDFNQTEEAEVLYWQPLPAPYNPKGE